MPFILEVFLIELKCEIDASAFNFLLSLSDKAKQIENYRCKKNKDLTLAGEFLSKYAINKVFNIPFKDMKIKTSKYGKPFLCSHKNIYFNISHSENIVVCVVSNRKVGIDVQKILNTNFQKLEKIVKRKFTQKERQMIEAEANENKLEQFYKIWAAKESYIKYIGTGLKDFNKDINKNCLIKFIDIKTPNFICACCFKP